MRATAAPAAPGPAATVDAPAPDLSGFNDGNNFVKPAGSPEPRTTKELLHQLVLKPFLIGLSAGLGLSAGVRVFNYVAEYVSSSSSGAATATTTTSYDPPVPVSSDV